MPTPPTPPIQLYAELLVNIRQVSVSASFASPVEVGAQQTQATAEVLPDGVTLRVHQRVGGDDELQTVTLTLPGLVAVAAMGVQLPLQGPALASGYVAWRLPLAGQNGPNGQTAQNGQSDDAADLAPWSAPDLRPKCAVACRACDAELVAAGRIQAWKDLPSDNWAEMMEFWHCHKPDTKHTKGDGNGADDGTSLADRGYGANSTISAEAGVGFVDLTTLLFSEADCQGLLVCSLSLTCFPLLPPPPPSPGIKKAVKLELCSHHSMSTDTNAPEQTPIDGVFFYDALWIQCFPPEASTKERWHGNAVFPSPCPLCVHQATVAEHSERIEEHLLHSIRRTLREVD